MSKFDPSRLGLTASSLETTQISSGIQLKYQYANFSPSLSGLCVLSLLIYTLPDVSDTKFMKLERTETK